MRILILGGDGYLGWPTAMYLSSKGHDIMILDNMSKRYWEAQMGVRPLLPVPPLGQRISLWHKVTGKKIEWEVCDISRDNYPLYKIFDTYAPDAIVHYAEQPSAPFSHYSRGMAVETMRNNIIGTLNVMFAIQHAGADTHIVKLGSMGEYGTPNIAIEEGWLDVKHKGRKDRVLYPKRPGSFYHLSKVHDSHNMEFGCRIWGLRVSDLNQGIVYGYETNEEEGMEPSLHTSFHYDAVFGTVLNRFIVQAACNRPLTIYGEGGQTRGFLNIKDTLRCVELALLTPADKGEFRVFNQFTEIFSIMDIAERVIRVAKRMHLDPDLTWMPNPRVEDEQHYYRAAHDALLKLGHVPYFLKDEDIEHSISLAMGERAQIDKEAFEPQIRWRQD